MPKILIMPTAEELAALEPSKEYPVISLPELREGEELNDRSGRKGLHPLVKKVEWQRVKAAKKLWIRKSRGEDSSKEEEEVEKVKPRNQRDEKAKAIEAAKKERMAKMHEGTRKKRREVEIIRAKMKENILLTQQEVDVITLHGNKRDKLQIKNQTAETIIGTKDVKELRAIVEQTAAKYMYNPIEELIRTSLHLDKKGKPMGEDMPRIDAKEKMNIDKALLPYLVAQVPPQKAQDSGSNSESKGVQVFINQIEFDGPINRPLAGVEPLHMEKPKMVETTIVQRD